MYVAYVDSTCHYVVLRGYYVADTIKFYEGLTQRLRGLPVALRMLRGSLRGPRFTWRLRYRQFLFPKFVLRCSYEAALRKGVTTALDSLFWHGLASLNLVISTQHCYILCKSILTCMSLNWSFSVMHWDIIMCLVSNERGEIALHNKAHSFI